ncbi:MAG: protein kinase [Cyanobacteria bacterium P01_A01_bin.123]
MTTDLLANRYRLLEKLGSSNMSQTYLAEDIQANDLKCVVKQLEPTRDGFNLLARNRQLFEAEAKALEELGSHNQIPCLQSYFEEETEFYLVQEFVDGIDLDYEIAIGQRWSESQAMRFLQEMLPLLAFVHNHNVIHRDIKPANIIRRCQDGKLVLIDFGAVKQIQVKQPKLSGQTSVAVIIGTPGYMPAEQANGKPHFSSDIYALGMVAIQALTGLLPRQLREDDNGELIWRDQAEVSDRLASILTKMVRQYFKHRYQTATDALADIQSLITDAQPAVDDHKQSTVDTKDTRPSQPLDADDPSIHGSSKPPPNQQRITPASSKSTEVATAVGASGNSGSPRTKRLVTVGVIAAVVSVLSSISYLVHAKSVQEHRQALADLQELYDIERYEECMAEAKALPTMNQNLTAQGEALAEACQMGHEQATVLQQIQTLEDDEDYEACIEAGGDFPGSDTKQSTLAMELLSRCRQQLALKLAGEGRYVAAINTATEITLQAPNYSEAQTLISQWSYRILELAEEKYQNDGDIDTAIAFVNAIPDTAAAYASAQRELPQWKAELASNQDLLQKAQAALDRGQWQAAINHARQVTTPYFQAAASPIISKANNTLDSIRIERDNLRRPLVDVEDTLGRNSPVLARSGTRYHEHTFEGQAGKTISIMMASEDFDPYLYLFGPNGDLVATNDDRPDGNYDSAINIPLNQTGTYRIQATAYSVYDRGRYSLEVRYVPE